MCLRICQSATFKMWWKRVGCLLLCSEKPHSCPSFTLTFLFSYLAAVPHECVRHWRPKTLLQQNMADTSIKGVPLCLTNEERLIDDDNGCKAEAFARMLTHWRWFPKIMACIYSPWTGHHLAAAPRRSAVHVETTKLFGSLPLKS